MIRTKFQLPNQARSFAMAMVGSILLPLTVLANEEAHEGGGLPQLAADTFPSQIFWLCLTFALLYLGVSYLFVPRIEKTLKKREDKIEQDFAKARTLAEEAEAFQTKRDETQKIAHQKALGILQHAQKEAADLLVGQTQNLQASFNEKVVHLDEAMAVVRSTYMKEIEVVASDICEKIVAKLCGDLVTRSEIEKAVSAHKKHENLRIAC